MSPALRFLGISPPPLPKTKRLQTISNSESEYKLATLIYLLDNLNLTLIWDGEVLLETKANIHAISSSNI